MYSLSVYSGGMMLKDQGYFGKDLAKRVDSNSLFWAVSPAYIGIQ
jgi:hypothetical protein